MAKFNRFGNMFPPEKYMKSSYLMAEEPFKIAGNLYFVGNTWCSSHLIDTGEGLILLDVPCYSEFPYTLNNIWKLGFNPKDIKYIIISHAHLDHYGSVNAFLSMCDAKTFMGEIDVADMENNPEKFERMNLGDSWRYNECFKADVALKDGDIIELGNTKIRCIWTPGHTDGCMSHFWQLEDNGKVYNVGIYGGAGYGALSTERLQAEGKSLSVQQTFVDSIDKVWNEKVDIMLGNHPFHNDTFEKHEKMLISKENPFIDPTEWHRYLQEMKDGFDEYLKLTSEEVKAMMAKSSFLTFRNIHNYVED